MRFDEGRTGQGARRIDYLSRLGQDRAARRRDREKTTGIDLEVDEIGVAREAGSANQKVDHPAAFTAMAMSDMVS